MYVFCFLMAAITATWIITRIVCACALFFLKLLFFLCFPPPPPYRTSTPPCASPLMVSRSLQSRTTQILRQSLSWLTSTVPSTPTFTSGITALWGLQWYCTVLPRRRSVIDGGTLGVLMLPKTKVEDFFFSPWSTLLNNFPVSPSSATAVFLPPSLLHHHAQPDPVFHWLQRQRGNGEIPERISCKTQYAWVLEKCRQPRHLLWFPVVTGEWTK